jgi:hypothetical protein
MKSLKTHAPSPAMLVAIIALIASFSGTAWAASKISGSQIKKSSIPGNRLKKSTITAKQIKKGTITAKQLKRHTLTGGQIDLSKLGVVPESAHAASADALGNLAVFGMKRLSASDGASQAAARSAAPESLLYTKGPFSIYAKCFHDTTGDNVYAEIYLRTSANGSIFYSDDDSAYGSGGTFLDSTTIETDRILSDGDGAASANSASAEDADYTPFWAMAPDGTTLQGASWEAVKNGTLPGGSQGVYGAGNVCLFTGRVFN